jgi:phosphoglycerate dehydrogenase-like enzyme
MRSQMNWKVLITARAFWTHGAAANDLLVSAGCTTIRSTNAGPLIERDLIPELVGCDAVIASSDIYSDKVFGECPELKVVSRWGVGIDAIDLEAATQAGVVVSNTPGAMAEAVADYTFGLLLAIARRIVEGDALMRAGGWDQFPGTLVYGKTIGLVGAGMIGRAVARRAAGFGMRILAFDPNGIASDASGIQFVGFDQLLKESDFVSIHAPSLPETQGMFDAARFAQMKPTAFLINAARGALVNEPDLLDALHSGKIAGAALDVYAREPLAADHPLRSAPRCVLTPHNASFAVETMERMSVLAAENVLSLIRGDHPKSTCNPAVWESPALRSELKSEH